MITLPPGPSNARNLIQRALEDLGAPQGPRLAGDPPLGGGEAAARVDASAALGVHVLKTADGVGQAMLDQSPLVGWRHLVVSGAEKGVADLNVSEDGGRFASLAWGADAERFADAADLAEKVAGGEASYEAKIVESPALKVAAIWLNGEKNIFIPYEGTPKVVELSEEDFFDLLRERLQRHEEALKP